MKKYYTEEERKAVNREKARLWREKNPEGNKENYKKNPDYWVEYRKKNKDKINDYRKKWRKEHSESDEMYRKTPMGRALSLINAYKKADKERNRGECTLTAKWVVDNIFTKPCHYCGKEGWEIIGCDRKDSNLPHTPENVVPSCKSCNDKKGTMSYDEFIKKLGESPLP